MEKPSTRFILYTGLRTIGGVNASVSYGRDRVLFECGGAYDPATAVYDGKFWSAAAAGSMTGSVPDSCPG